MEIFSLETALGRLLPGIPSALVWLAALVMAVIFWRRHPRVSLLVTLGFVIWAMLSVAGFIVGNFLPLFIHTRTGMDFERIARITNLIGLGLAFAGAVPLALLVAAVFTERVKG